MKRRDYVLSGAGALVVITLVVLATTIRGQDPPSEVKPVPEAASESQTEFGYEAYGEALAKFVDADGMIDYKGLKAAPGKLNVFLKAVADLTPADFEKFPEKAKIAFWTNAYNALTLDAIVTNYPIKSSFAKSLVYPKNSIRQIAGVWDKLKWNVMGSQMTLEDIEHKRLRVDFVEPRIHMALVCAAMGCPSLRNEPYVAERLDEQLDDEAGKLFSDALKFRIDRKAKRVYLSSIFKWFGSDFVSKYPPGEKFADFDEDERAVLAFVSRYLSGEDREFLEAGGYSVKYLDYDWTLNEKTSAAGD